MYIWEKEIKSVKDWLVEYKDWTKELYSEEYLTYFTSKESKSLDEFSLYKRHKIISDIMSVCVKTNSTMDDINSVIDGVISSIEHAKDEAVSKLLWVNHPWNINFKTINDVVLKK